MSRKDLYEILEVDKTATKAEIKSSYRKIAMVYHPDKQPGKTAERILKEINEAYDILYDDEKRANYDKYGIADEKAIAQRKAQEEAERLRKQQQVQAEQLRKQQEAAAEAARKRRQQEEAERIRKQTELISNTPPLRQSTAAYSPSTFKPKPETKTVVGIIGIIVLVLGVLGLVGNLVAIYVLGGIDGGVSIAGLGFMIFVLQIVGIGYWGTGGSMFGSGNWETLIAAAVILNTFAYVSIIMTTVGSFLIKLWKK